MQACFFLYVMQHISEICDGIFRGFSLLPKSHYLPLWFCLNSRFYSLHLPDQSSILHLHPDPPCPTCSYHLRTALSTGFDPHFDPRFSYIQLKIFYYTKDLYSSKISMTRRITEIKAQKRKCLPFGFRRKEEKYRPLLNKRCCKHYTTFLPYFRLKTPILLLLFLSSIG